MLRKILPSVHYLSAVVPPTSALSLLLSIRTVPAITTPFCVPSFINKLRPGKPSRDLGP